MARALRYDAVKLIVTSRGPEPARRLRFILRTAIPGSRVRGTGFRGVVALEAAGDALELAEIVGRQCSKSIGHLTAVLAVVDSRQEPIRDAAATIAAAQIGATESFCFRLHKRGAHGLEQATSELEKEIGGAIWTALQEKYSAKPRVNLKRPDVTVTAEILGPSAAMGICRKAWFRDDGEG